jgi:hypothetical protein
MEGDAEACHTTLSFDRGDDIIRKRDRFQGFGKDELSGLDVKLGSFSFFCMGVKGLFLIRVDHIIAWFVPDKMITKADIKGVGLNKRRIEWIDADVPPFDMVCNFPVYQNHILLFVG